MRVRVRAERGAPAAARVEPPRMYSSGVSSAREAAWTAPGQEACPLRRELPDAPHLPLSPSPSSAE